MYDQMSDHHLSQKPAPTNQNGAKPVGTPHLREEAVKLLPIKRATHYLQSTTKHERNESFAEKIVSLRNMMKTGLHIIR